MYRIPVAVVLAALTMVTPVQADSGWQVAFRGGARTYVADLAATGPADAWAAGRRETRKLDPRTGSPVTAPLIRHWNGRQWTEFPGPGGPLREISLIEASSPADVWIAGSTGARSVLSRWDGRRWRLMGSGRTTITDLDVPDGGHAWVVGRDDRTRGVFFKRYHGGRWTSLPAPASLREISVRTAGEIWGWGPSAVMRWDGKAWHPVALPAVAVPAAAQPAYGPVRVRYDAVLAAANGDVWIAAGFQQGDWPQPGAVLLHRRGGTWEQLRLPADRVTTLSGDGSGGVYAATTRQSITATPDGQDPYAYTTLSVDALRYAGGVLTRQSVTPPATGFEWTDLVAVPRTGSALAAGFAWKPPQGDVIFRNS
ncbi:hypothetical protein [Nonomuraea angiospora]